jgi:hypothetical protein
MADKRINALATTAPNTASDDFFAVDGTTNGTRKLNAFSPTFGGNATVTGTLTVNGTTASVGAGTGSIISKLNGAAGSYKLSIYQSAGVDRWYAGLAAGAESGSDGGAPYSIVALTDAGAVIDNALLITRAAGGSITTPRPVSISATTASTSTSSGALVVGNGTSGGLGVGGAASIGGPILVGTSSDVYLSRTGAGVLDLRSASTPGTLGRLDINGTTSAAVGFRQTGSRDWFITAESFELRVSCLTAASIFAFNSGTPVAMRDSTASTSTSSGALVVSGGVGVAGAIYAGGYVSTGTHARIGAQSSVVALSANNNVDGGLPAAWTGNYGVGVQYLGSSSNAFFIGDGSGGSTYFYTRTGSANTARLSIDNTNGNVTIGGTLQVGNAYVGGAPTATGYIVIKDSTGTSYKIPAVAL